MIDKSLRLQNRQALEHTAPRQTTNFLLHKSAYTSPPPRQKNRLIDLVNNFQQMSSNLFFKRALMVWLDSEIIWRNRK